MSDATGEQAHLSIGEVLSLVQADFPDITISKIRFLESQGLLDPERTPSGYRKFYDADIERLQWILAQQRDHFLPLKVIRERLAEWDETGTPPEPGADPGTEHVAEAAATGEPAPLLPDPAPSDPDPTPPEPDVRHAAAFLAAASAIEVAPPAAAAPPTAPEVEAAPEQPPVEPPRRTPPDDSSLTAEELAGRAGVGVSSGADSGTMHGMAP